MRTASHGETARAPAPTVTVSSHRQLVAQRHAIIAALAADPRGARMFVANPALAFRAVGVELAPAVADHVLHTAQQPARVRARREQLAAQLAEELGGAPHPSDQAWLARTVFGTLAIHPLDTAGHTPPYLPALPPDAVQRLTALLPQPDHRAPARHTPEPAAPSPSVPPLWRLDLDAPVPRLPRTRARPRRLDLPTLWFYLPQHETIRPLLELGILEVSVMRVLPPEAFARVRDGEDVGGFIDWVQAVSFPAGSRSVAPP